MKKMIKEKSTWPDIKADKKIIASANAKDNKESSPVAKKKIGTADKDILSLQRFLNNLT